MPPLHSSKKQEAPGYTAGGLIVFDTEYNTRSTEVIRMCWQRSLNVALLDNTTTLQFFVVCMPLAFISRAAQDLTFSLPLGHEKDSPTQQ